MSPIVNVVVVGDSQCGKTSLLTSFFKKAHQPGEDVPNFDDYVTTGLEIDGELVALELRDTVSSEACRRFFIDTLSSCKKSLDICIHLLTAREISAALYQCLKRGVKVRVICDNEFATTRGSQIFYLKGCGIDIKVPDISYRMHNKFAIVDQRKFLTGSVNWTIQGFYGNWDNILVTTQKEIVHNAVAAFEVMWNHPNSHKMNRPMEGFPDIIDDHD